MVNLNDEQKKKLKRFSLYLQSSEHEDGIQWNLNIYDYYDMEGLTGPHSINRYDNISFKNFQTEIKFLENTIEEYVDGLDFESILSCDGCTGYGHFTATFNPESLSIECTMDITTSETTEYNNQKSFDELSKIQSQYNWSRYDYLKLLGDDSKVNEWKTEYGNEIEVTYDGYGDSGQLNEDNFSNEIEYLIYEIIDYFHSGWEINEGSSGTVVLDFENKKVKVIHFQNYEDSFEQTLDTINLN
jgi:hypothetical protein